MRQHRAAAPRHGPVATSSCEHACRRSNSRRFPRHPRRRHRVPRRPSDDALCAGVDGRQRSHRTSPALTSPRRPASTPAPCKQPSNATQTPPPWPSSARSDSTESVHSSSPAKPQRPSSQTSHEAGASDTSDDSPATTPTPSENDHPTRSADRHRDSAATQNWVPKANRPLRRDGLGSEALVEAPHAGRAQRTTRSPGGTFAGALRPRLIVRASSWRLWPDPRSMAVVVKGYPTTAVRAAQLRWGS